MKSFWKIIVSIAFGVILLEFVVVANNKNWFELTNLRIASMASAAALIFYFIFEYKKKQ